MLTLYDRCHRWPSNGEFLAGKGLVYPDALQTCRAGAILGWADEAYLRKASLPIASKAPHLLRVSMVCVPVRLQLSRSLGTVKEDIPEVESDTMEHRVLDADARHGGGGRHL